MSRKQILSHAGKGKLKKAKQAALHLRAVAHALFLARVTSALVLSIGGFLSSHRVSHNYHLLGPPRRPYQNLHQSS